MTKQLITEATYPSNKLHVFNMDPDNEAFHLSFTFSTVEDLRKVHNLINLICIFYEEGEK